MWVCGVESTATQHHQMERGWEVAESEVEESEVQESEWEEV